MTAEVSRSHADLVLLLCYVVTGLLDSASIQVWGSFVSMQTGKQKGLSFLLIFIFIFLSLFLFLVFFSQSY